MRSMARERVRRSLPLVNVPVIFTREELAGVDFMARVLRLDRGAVVKRALDVLAAVGPQEVAALHEVGIGEIVSGVHCSVCGGTDW